MQFICVSTSTQIHHNVRMHRILYHSAVRPFKPLVLQSNNWLHSLLWLVFEHTLDEYFGIGTELIPSEFVKIIITTHNLAHEVHLILAHEGWEACEQEVSDDADGPDVAGQIVVLRFEDFRCHEV